METAEEEFGKLASVQPDSNVVSAHQLATKARIHGSANWITVCKPVVIEDVKGVLALRNG